MVNKEPLEEFLKTAKDWEKLETDIPGVFVVKIPGTKTRPARLMVEINPLDPDTKLPRKKKGLFVSDFDMLLQYQEALMEESVSELVRLLDEINPVKKKTSKKILKLKDD